MPFILDRAIEHERAPNRLPSKSCQQVRVTSFVFNLLMYIISVSIIFNSKKDEKDFYRRLAFVTVKKHDVEPDVPALPHWLLCTLFFKQIIRELFGSKIEFEPWGLEREDLAGLRESCLLPVSDSLPKAERISLDTSRFYFVMFHPYANNNHKLTDLFKLSTGFAESWEKKLR